jgi:cation diffusion facilitator CzcD-associated flavoprotein CzcO
VTTREVVVVGAGFGGIGMARELVRRGVTDFELLERDADVGGTWRANTYPGCQCDIPSNLYSFSFAPKPDWSRFFAPQPEIQEYVRAVAREHGVYERTRFGVHVHSAAWNGSRWLLETSDGVLATDVLVCAAGPWHEPLVPDLPGLGDFAGPQFHSSRWDHDVDLAGKRVAVIGTGASAVQFVPELAPVTEHLTVFQRTPHWVLPKLDRRVTRPEQALMRRVPAAHRALRGSVFAIFEALNAAMHRPRIMRELQRIGELHLRLTVRDRKLRAALTPDWTLGCKRILMSNDWYPALTRDDVTVVPRAVASVEHDAVVDTAGVRHEADAIVFGTGFRILDMPVADLVRGRDGRSLAEAWAGSPRAYLGTTVAGFPNLFLFLGPNQGVNTAATVLIEYQAQYVAEAIATMERDGVRELEVRADHQDAYNAWIDEALDGTVWDAGGCGSYFLDANGRNGFMYPKTARDLRRRMGRFDREVYACA